MIRSTGVFLDTSAFTAMWTLKYHERADNGLLHLHSELGPMPILKEWKSARALLLRYKAAAAPLIGGATVELGRVYLEYLPGQFGTPWERDESNYAQTVIRTRTCLIPSPDAYSHSGLDRVLISTGIVNVVEHRVLCSEINLSVHPRLHLIVDIKRPSDLPDEN